MPFMVWNDQLSVSIEAIDTDHKQLVAILNELYDAIHAGHGREAVTEIIERLVDYTRYHFAREEELFSSTGYLDAAAHKRGSVLRGGVLFEGLALPSCHRFRSKIRAAPEGYGYPLIHF